MKIIGKAKFDAIDTLRFPLIIMVIYIHMIPTRVQPVQLGWNSTQVFRLVSELVSHNIGRIVVPCFFLFSGYFFFYKLTEFNRKIYITQLKKRIHSLAIPYFLWNALFVVVIVVKNVIFLKAGKSTDDEWQIINTRNIYELFWGDPVDFPLWYLRDLICMVLLSPLFYFYFRYFSIYGLMCLTLIYLSCWESAIPGLSTTAITFFGIGAYMGQFKYNLIISSAYRKIIFSVAIIVLILSTYYNGKDIYEYLIRCFIVLGVISIMYLADFWIKFPNFKSKMLSLSPTVFFIYAVHGIYIINWTKGGIGRIIFFNSGWGTLIAYLIAPWVCLIVCMGMYTLIKHLFPKILAFSLGGRA